MWNFDISAAPRDRQILMRTTRDGDRVFVTNWLEPTKHCQNGRFNGFSENAKSLLAWCEIPAFENSEIQANPEEAGVHGEAESVPAVDAGSRPAIGRSMAATSEIMDATGGESAATGETSMVLGTGRERPLSIGLHTDGDPEARFETDSLHQNSEFAPASQGEAEAHSVERVSPDEGGSAAANIGGGHVTDGENTQPVPAGELVSRSPAFLLDDVGGE